MRWVKSMIWGLTYRVCPGAHLRLIWTVQEPFPAFLNFSNNFGFYIDRKLWQEVKIIGMMF